MARSGGDEGAPACRHATGASRLRAALLASTVLRGSALLLTLPAALADPALANPEGGVVVGGPATISQPHPGQLDVRQHSDRAIIDWHIGRASCRERVCQYA